MVKRIIALVIISMFAIFCLLPLILTVAGSFMSFEELRGTTHFIPQDFTLIQYEEILLMTPHYLIWFWNTFKITFI